MALSRIIAPVAVLLTEIKQRIPNIETHKTVKPGRVGAVIAQLDCPAVIAVAGTGIGAFIHACIQRSTARL